MEVKKLDEKQYRQYKLLRNHMVFVLQQIWPSLKEKIDNMIDEASTTKLGSENSLFLKSVIADFESKCVNKIVDFSWPSERDVLLEYEKNLKEETRLVHETIGEILNVYSDFFNPFLSNVEFISTNNWHESLPDSIKFRFYNIELRHPTNGKTDFGKCDADNAKKLLKSNNYKMELMQGYWQTEAMVREMRNYEEHWKRDGKDILKKLQRHVVDPLSQAQSTANVFTLCSSIILISHHFLEVLQTWIDTCKLVTAN